MNETTGISINSEAKKNNRLRVIKKSNGAVDIKRLTYDHESRAHGALVS